MKPTGKEELEAAVGCAEKMLGKARAGRLTSLLCGEDLGKGFSQGAGAVEMLSRRGCCELTQTRTRGVIKAGNKLDGTSTCLLGGLFAFTSRTGPLWPWRDFCSNCVFCNKLSKRKRSTLPCFQSALPSGLLAPSPKHPFAKCSGG